MRFHLFEALNPPLMASEFGSLLNAELLATCNSLGSYEGNTYEPDPYCLESLKDLIRFLRKDDESHEIRRQLGTIQVLQNDLLPILKFQNHRMDLFDVTLRFLVNLTTPPLLIYKEEIPTDKASRNHYLEMLAHVQAYKKAFTDAQLWVVITSKLATLLKKEYEDRVEDDTLTMERILVLVRNILHVPADIQTERRTDDDVSLHDQILWALYMSGLKDLFIYISTAETESMFYLHVLEILSLMVREQTPEQLVQAGKLRSEAEKQRDMEALLRKRQEEVEKRQQSQKKYSRFSRFSGTFYVKNVKSISDRDLIAHKMVDSVNDINFDRTKKIHRKPKNRRPTEEAQVFRKSTLSIRLFLKDFCLEFISNAYNPFMAQVRREIERPAGSHSHDETYFLWAMRFFMELNRLEGQETALVSETMSVSNFHYILTHLENYYEMMVTDKKKTPLWARRMHMGLQAYKELVMTLQAMDSSTEENVKKSADVIKGNIFYLMEYRDLLITLINNYDEVKLSKSYLADLVETIHVFMRMLERYCRGHSHLVVQQKAPVRSKKKKSKNGGDSQLSLDDRWTPISNVLSELLISHQQVATELNAFDAGSDKSEDQMREEAKQKIRMCLRRSQSTDALALLRMCRDLWPEDSAFGSPSCAPEEELLLLQELFFLPGPEGGFLLFA
ncbi:TIMELESS [Cordylochernes scorpioides]|uniref:TIMELESS n=1 Tax=Cordylochernes scorpioides TaxID=51811 RepID=A0ABY6LP03_9ARAC|nr:TIMELESS [Cordylochernes scorpioides]